MVLRMTKQKKTQRARFAIGLLSLALVMFAAQAQAATIQVGFSGANQAFAGVANVFGTVTATAQGTVWNPDTEEVENFMTVPPVAHIVKMNGGFVLVETSPASQNLATFGVTGSHVDSIAGLNLDLMNGAPGVGFTLSEISINTNSNVPLLASVPFSLSATISGLTFNQTGGATLNPLGEGVGNYSVPGTFTATLSNIEGKFFGVIPVPMGNLTLTYDSALTGVYSLSGPVDNTSLTLNGGLFNGFALAFADSFSASIGAPLDLSVEGTAALNAQLNVQGGYYLEQLGIVVPEPRTLLMLGLGLAVLLPAAYRMRTR